MSSETVSLLRALIHISGRSVYDEDGVREIVSPKSKKLLNAYNLCDGTRTQQDVVKRAKLDSGNFSRTLVRWIQKGIVHRIESGDRVTLLHVFPV